MDDWSLIIFILEEYSDEGDIILCNFLEILDEAFVLKDLNDLELKIGSCNIYFLMLCLTSISDLSQHICNWITNCHILISYQLDFVTPGI